jgi:hypothetical protein
MDKGKIILAFLLIALLFAIGKPAAASVRTPGVSVGDTFTYSNVSFNWYSNDPSATPPTEWEGLNGTAWFRGTVGNVVGTNVTSSSLSHYNNGTERTQNGWLDVDTGDGVNMSLIFVSANLNAGDFIYSSGIYSTWYINETISRTYPGGPRDTNHINVTMEASSPPYAYIYLSTNFYWDRATGVLTKVSITSNETTTYTTNWSVTFELTGSNKWTVPEFVGLPQILLLLASLTLVTLAHRRRLYKTQNR